MSGSCRKKEISAWTALFLCVNLWEHFKGTTTPIHILCVDFWEFALVCVYIIYDACSLGSAPMSILFCADIKVFLPFKRNKIRNKIKIVDEGICFSNFILFFSKSKQPPKNNNNNIFESSLGRRVALG